MEEREENPFGVNLTKRYVSEGAEKILFVTTIILAILFGVLAVVSFLINS